MPVLSASHPIPLLPTPAPCPDITIKVVPENGRWYKCSATLTYNETTNEMAIENAECFKTKINQILEPHGAVLRVMGPGQTPWAGTEPCFVYEHTEAVELAGFVVEMMESFGVICATVAADIEDKDESGEPQPQME